MTASYQVRVYDVAGSLTAIFDHWNSLYYYLKYNDTDTITFSISGDDPRRAFMATDAMIEVLRSDPAGGVSWGVEFGGFLRTHEDQTTDKNYQLLTEYGRAYLDLLHRREVLYYTGTPQDTKTGPADDVMKAYVRENLASLATIANGRFIDGQTPGFSVQGDTSQGPTWHGSGSYRNVLDVVQAISKSSGVGFDVVRTGAATFQFRTYFPTNGTDRTGAGTASPVVFSPTLANMSMPYGIDSHTGEANDIIVLGQGDGAARAWVERGDVAAQNLSPWNRIERTKDQRNATDTAALQAEGDAQLKALQAVRSISFTAIQSPATVYGRDFRLGDLVLARYRGQQQTKKVIGIEITVANGKEDLRVHFDDPTAVTL